MQLKKLALSVAALSTLGLCSSASAYTSHEEQIIVHPFQWTYDMIADECEQVLGPNGFDGVQISQPAEHINRTDVWWAVYQPVNFKNFTTMTGNEEQLRSMIKRCNAAGVKVYADAVFNHRGNNGTEGLGGSRFDARSLQYPDMGPEDFNNNNCSPNYSDKWSIYNCALSGMPDINVLRPETQDKIADYLKNLMSMGVYGFRIDAAKHMQPAGINAILAKAGNPFSYMEVIGAGGEAVQPRDYTNIPNTVVTEFKYCPTMMSNIQNPKPLLSMADNWFDVNSDGAETFVANHDNERGSAGTQYLNFVNPRFDIAQSFLVAWPYGKIRQVYSGYQFSNHDPAGPFGADRCQGGWNCEHRASIVLNAVGFARATRGYGVSYKGGSDDGKVIWFTRGDKGFYVMNSGDSPVKWTFDTHMPDGQYCEILQQQEKCGGQQIAVKNGKAEITVYGKSAAAFCIDDSGKGFCGELPPPCAGDGCPPPQDPELYFAGTTNGWHHEKMWYDDNKGTWSIIVDFTGEGDASGPQRFKFTSDPDWKHKIWGDGKNGTLCNDEVKCPDVVFDKQGRYLITVHEPTMQWWPMIYGRNNQPEVDMSADTNGMTATFTNASSDPDGDALSYTWDFGDGIKSNEENPVHKYVSPGVYHVTLTVTDNINAPVSKTIQVTVEDVVGCEPVLSELYYAGTSNGWKHQPMTYNSDICKWSIDLSLTGKSDSNGAQRFKLTSAPNWKHKVWGKESGNKLCKDQSRCGDVKIAEKGNYTLLVDESNMTWTLVPNGGVYIAPTRDALYYAGTTNGWKHQKMTYNSGTGDWEIILTLTGDGDSRGGERFKVTSDANWKGKVWGANYDSHILCSDQSRCGDVYPEATGTYVLKVNDREMIWSLDPM